MKDVISNNPILMSINSNDPVYHIEDCEFNDALLKYGSLVSILRNKRINQTMLLSELLDSQDHQECFSILSGIESPRILFYNIIIRFPILCKSKIIKKKISELSNEQS